MACREVKPKRQLVRLVRVPEGRIEIDAEGTKAGRGAYLCPRPECWEKGLKGNRMEHVLRTSLSATDRDRLARYYQECICGQPR